MEATYMSINRWMEKENVVPIHNGIFLSLKKNEVQLVLVRWGSFPGGSVVKNPPAKKKKITTTCQDRRHKKCKFNLWVQKIPLRRKRQPVPVFLPEKFHGQRILVSYSPWSHKESDTNEHACARARTHTHTHTHTHTSEVDEPREFRKK